LPRTHSGRGVVTKLALILTINGQRHEVLTEPHRTLLDVLRADLGLTGTKENCLEAECGVCTVLVDGRTVNACILLAARRQGRGVPPIEGLGRAGQPPPPQRAFIDHGAVQCASSTPAMILSAKAYLDEHPTPTEGQVREALAGNLCRCTGYQKIVDAVLAASREFADRR